MKRTKKKLPRNILTTVIFTVCSVTTLFAQTPPHVARHGANLVKNPGVNTPKNWSLVRDAVYDETVSRSKDGSGSFRLVTPLPTSSMAVSENVPVEQGKTYTFGFYFKTVNGPTNVGAQISLHDEKGTYLRNLISAHGGTTRDDEWQEFALPFTVPEGVVSVGLQVYKTENTKPGGQVWADDFYLGEGLGLEQPPSPKTPFDGAQVRVDHLGNFEVKEGDDWKPFFPLCMFSDNTRDWSVYSKQGWNTIMWAGSAQQIKQAKDARSDFNPKGMRAGFQISQYTFPSGWAYNDMADLTRKMKDISEGDLNEILLLLYWDNENNHDQWQVPVEVINTIKKLDVDSSGKRLHPIYALQGTYNLARVHAAKGLVDVTGTYFGGSAADNGGAGTGGEEGFFVLDHLEKQTNPAAFAQFNGVDGAGEMRLRLYNAITSGARAMGYWVDAFNPGLRTEFPKVGPVDEKAWWPDFPNLRREVDQLLPLIREPQWTSWKATAKEATQIRIGTRDHDSQSYVWLINQSSTPREVILKLEDLPYRVAEVRDYFDDSKIATVEGGTFSLNLPGIGISSGTKVLRLVSGKK